MEDIDNVIASTEALTLADITRTHRNLTKLLEDKNNINLEYIHKCEEDLLYKFVMDVSRGEYRLGEIQEIARNLAALKRLKYTRSY